MIEIKGAHPKTRKSRNKSVLLLFHKSIQILIEAFTSLADGETKDGIRTKK